MILAACAGGGHPTGTTAPSKSVASPASPTAGAEAVTAGLQLDLKALGFDPGTVSGQFTAATQGALARFQQAQGLPAGEHGALGPATARAIGLRLVRPSEAVRALQSALTDIGLYHGVIDGSYSTATLAAVESLQRQAGLSVDGQFGPLTAAALTRLYRRTAAVVAAPPTTVPPPRTYLALGDTGPKVATLQQRLAALGYRPGSSGTYDAQTASAVLAFQKREGLGRDGLAGTAVEAAIGDPHGAGPRGGPVPRIEVDIARQIAFVVLPSQPVITLNVSTGSGATYRDPAGGTDVAYTPVGSFTVQRKIEGDQVAPLGTLHDPMYFYGGWAVHGAASVPAYPASHGCVRVSDIDADWLFPQIAVGTAVVIYGPGPAQSPAGATPGF